MKRVFLVHGWAVNPNNYWFPWLKKELEKKDYKVFVPRMPNPKFPEIETWVSFLKEQVGEVDKKTFFVGHSIGCQTIMRYLETLDENERTGKIIFVAGFFNLPFLETGKEKTIAKPWLETKIDTEKIKKIAGKTVAIFSDNDEYVPLSDKEIFKKRLDAEIVVLHGKGHFSEGSGIKKIPEILRYF